MQSDKKGNSWTERMPGSGLACSASRQQLSPRPGAHAAQECFCGLERWESPKGRNEGQGERRGAVKFRSMLELWHIWVRVKIIRDFSQEVCVVKNTLLCL